MPESAPSGFLAGDGGVWVVPTRGSGEALDRTVGIVTLLAVDATRTGRRRDLHQRLMGAAYRSSGSSSSPVPVHFVVCDVA